MITYQYRVNMTPGGIAPRCKLNQYDDDWTIVFSLYSDAGEFTIQSGTTAKIRGTKRDGLGYSANATIDISNRKVTVTGDKQITAVAGENTFELVLYKGEKELSTANVIFYVEPAAMDAGTLVSDSQVQEILNMSADVIAASANVNTLRGNFAPTYSTSGTYAIGDYVISSNQLYRCITAITTAEAWTPSHWKSVSLGRDVTDLKNDVDAFDNTITETTKNIADSPLGRFYVKNDGTVATSSQNYYGMKYIVPCSASASYYIKFYGVTGGSTLQTFVSYYDSSKGFVELVKVANSDHGTFTTPATCGYLCAFIYASGGVTISSQAALQIESGTTQTGYVPPRSAVDVEARKEIDNLESYTDDFKDSITEQTRNIADSALGRFYVESNGSVSASNQNYYGMKSIVPCVANTGYYIKFYGVTSGSTLQTNVAYYDSSKALIEIVKVANSDHATFTTPATCGYLCAFIYASGGVNVGNQAALQIEIGTTATDYTPPLCAVDVDARLEIDNLKSNINAFNDTITEPTKNIADSALGRFYVDSNGAITVASNQNYFGMKHIVPCAANAGYYIKFYGVAGNSTLQTYVAYYNSSKTFIEFVKVANSDHGTFTTPVSCVFLCAFIYASEGLTFDAQSALQIEIGANPTGYAPPLSAVDVEARRVINPMTKLNNRGYYGTSLYDSANIPFEYGTIGLVSDQTSYTESFSRVRIPRGSEIYLKKGDYITQKNTSTSRFYVIYRDEVGVMHASGATQNPYYVTESGYYSLVLRLEPETEQSGLLDTLAGNIVIYNNGTSETENVLFRPRKTRTVAHGSGGTTNMVVPGGDPVPENSISGLIAAAKAGYWGVEFDARITKDGEWISLHDATLDRTTEGTGNAADYTLAELKQIHVKKKIDGVYTLTDEYLASVDELLDASVIYGLVPIIDLKWDANLVTENAVKALAQKLIDRHIEKHSAVNCSGINALIWIKKLNRSILTYRQLTSDVVNPLTNQQMEYARYGNAGVSVSQDLAVFTKEWTRTMQSYGYSIAAWTSYPTTRERTKEVLDYGVDCYFSEQLPDVLTLKYDE